MSVTLDQAALADHLDWLDRTDERLAALVSRFERIAEEYGALPLPKPRPHLHVVKGGDDA